MKQKHSSFRHQLIISYLMISMIPIVLILSVVFIKMYKGEQAAVSERLSSGAELIASQFNSLLDNMSFISINLISSPQVLAAAKGLGHENNTLLKEQEYYSRLKKEFCSYAIVSSPYRVTFFNGKGQYITSRNYNMEFSSHYRLPEEEIGKINWMEEVEGNYGQSILLPVQENAMPLSEGQFLTLARAVRDPGKNIGYLGVSVEMEQVNNILSIGTQMGAEVLFLSEEGETICHTEGFPVGECYENGIWNLDGIRKDYFIADNYHKDNGIMTVLVYPQWKVMKEGVEGIWAFVAEAILFLVLTMVIIFHYSNKMTRPLQRLTRQMQEITIDGLDGHEGKEFHGYEEVEFLYTGYAKMQERLNVMIRNEITSQTLLMQERLNFLQSQINPHFLYNTLNVIGIMGMENENRRVYDACFKLSSLLRYSLGDNSEGTATIRQEMDNTTSYLELMKLRYEHRLDFEVSCEEKMEGLEVPRLILQPFVENVFEHVYSLEHRKVAVQVKGYCEGNGYRLMISDDGQGMKEAEAARLMEKIKVIIAEDEPPIARFIKMLTEQEEDFLVTAICENGEDALKEVESSSARLLITDIRMLGMDGLELIRRIRQKNQEIRILIISGYKMFEYAREAIRFGIEDYITKPIEPEEFAGVLCRVRRHYAREERLERQLRLEKALKNKDGEAWAENVPGELLEVMNIYQSGDANENIPFHVRMMEDVYILNYKDSLLYLRCPEAGENGKAAGKLRKIMELQSGRTVAGVLIRKVRAREENIWQIRELYRHVRKLAVPGQKVIQDYEDITMIKPLKRMAGDERLKRLKIDMEAGNRKQFMEDFRKLFDAWEKKKETVYQMKAALYEMAEGLGRVGWLQGESIAWKEYIDDSIHYSDSYKEIRENLAVFLDESIKEGNDGGRNGKEARILFEEICELIEKRMDRNYSLAEISTSFGVSQPYIRKVFKTFAGVTYNEYVLKEKIEMAKKLMELNPYIMIKDVADAIGYEQLYFSTVFSKREGMSPSKYKLTYL